MDVGSDNGDNDDDYVGDMEDVVGLEGTLQSSGSLHQLFQHSYVGRLLLHILILIVHPHQHHPCL